MAISDSTISWIGAEHAIPVAGTPDRVIDLDGALVVPGFVDAHVHSTEAGLALTGLDLSGTRSLAECLAAVRSFADRTPDGVLWGHGWEDTRWPERRAPTRAEIDEAVGNRARLPLPGRRALGAGQLGTRVGRLRRRLADRLVGPVAGQSAGARRGASALRGNSSRAGNGPTRRWRSSVRRPRTGSSRCTSARRPTRLGAVTWRRSSQLAARSRCGGIWRPRSPSRPKRWRCWRTAVRTRLGGDLVIDGAIGSRTAALRSDYHDDSGNCGARYLTDQQIADHLVACTLAGVQAGFHAIGDDAVHAVGAALLEAVRRLGDNATVRLAGCAHRIEHAEMPDDDDIAAFAATGVVASMQPLFDAAWGGPDGLYAARSGADRAAAMNPFATMAAAGVSLAFGSDAPVTPADPWAAVQAAAHHRTPGSGLSPRAAFTAHTRGGHRAAGRTDRGIGTISVGAPAHLAILAAGRAGATGRRPVRCPVVHRPAVQGSAAARSRAGGRHCRPPSRPSSTASSSSTPECSGPDPPHTGRNQPPSAGNRA